MDLETLIRLGGFAKSNGGIDKIDKRQFKDAEQEIRRRYKSLLNWSYGSRVNEFKQLYDVTQVKPKFSVKYIQSIYRDCFFSGSLDDVATFHSIVGVDPQYHKYIQDVYQSYLERATDEVIPDAAEYLGRLQELIAKTEVIPDVDIVQNAYFRFVSGGYVDELRKTMEITGIAPEEKLIQRGYNELLKEFMIGEIKEISEITGIKPQLKQDAVLQAYDKTADDFYGHELVCTAFNILKLQEMTGISPPAEVYGNLVHALIGK